jgi:alpha-galactosidase
VTVTNLQPAKSYVQFADVLGWTFADETATFRSFRINQWGIYPSATNFEPLQDVLDPEGTPIDIQSGARGPNCAWFAIADHTGRGLFAGWEFDGRTDAQIQHLGSGNTIRLSASIADLNHPVDPGADFRLPAAFVGVFQGDWDYAGYRTQRFAENVLAKAAPDPEHFPYVAWDSWGYQQQISEYNLRRNAEAAARLGFELFTVDLGWARQIGDWRDDPAKFPGGLRAVSDNVHSLGMKFGLHFAFAEAAPDSPVLTQNPDWTSSVTYGYFGAKSLCLSNKATHDWVVQEAIRIIDDYNVDWILQDGENMVKQCTKTTHTHDPKDSNYSNAVDGLNSIINAVQKARPNVSWENCADGGTMMTFNMVKNYVTSITNDASSISDSRRAAFGATYPFPPRYADRYMTEQVLDKYTTRSYMFGGPWIFMNRLTDFSAEDESFAASEIRLFKGMRSSIRDGQVFHINAPARDTVDAIQSHNANTGVSVAVVTRDGATSDYYNLLFRGLTPETTYMVTFQEDRRILTYTGLQLMRSGVVIYLPDPHYSEIVFALPLAGPPEN